MAIISEIKPRNLDNDLMEMIPLIFRLKLMWTKAFNINLDAVYKANQKQYLKYLLNPLVALYDPV